MTGSHPLTLFARVAAVFEQSPRDVVVNDAVGTISVPPVEDGGQGSLIMVMSSSQVVRCYSVWPEPVPEDRRSAMAEYTTRANTGLSTALFTLDLDNGILSLVAGLLFDDAELVELMPEPVFGRLVWLALLEVEAQAARHAPGVAAVLAGA